MLFRSAEGIETKDEMDKLIEFGVDYMQGYYLGKPNMIPQALDPKVKSEIKNFYDNFNGHKR